MLIRLRKICYCLLISPRARQIWMPNRRISTCNRLFCKDERSKSDDDDDEKKPANRKKTFDPPDKSADSKDQKSSETKKSAVDFVAENKRRIAEILEYYSQYEKELAAGGYKDPDVEPLLETADDGRQQYSFEMSRGSTGVFDLDEIVEVLRREKAKDVCSIEMPQEMSYADYIVLCTPMGSRHSNAICETIYTLYKKKRSKSDPQAIVRPQKNVDWAVCDLGNIVVHVMTEEIRRRYDIETLWAVGPLYDDLTMGQTSIDKMEENFKNLKTDLEWIKNVKTKT